MTFSLRRRLLGTLIGLLALGWITAAVSSYYDTHRGIEELFDAQLAQSARILYSLTSHEVQEQATSDKAIPFQKNSVEDNFAADHPDEHKLVYQIWLNDYLAAGSANSPGYHLALTPTGFSDRLIDGVRWRIFAMSEAGNPIAVEIGEDYDIREKLTSAIVFRMTLPILLALPILAVLVWFSVGRVLRPLDLLAAQMRLRDPENLTPVTVGNVPSEVQPLVTAMNNLFERLHEAFESERCFTTNAAHELRTPLAAIKIQAQVAERVEDAMRKRVALQHVIMGVDRATHMVEQLLTLARLDPQSALTTLEQADLCYLSTQVLIDCAPLALTKNIELALNDTCHGTVYGHPPALSILIRNLVDNAIRYSHYGGCVEVQAAMGPEGTVLSVIDNGPGIPEEDRQRVFERFYRRLDTKTVGSGLGLSIVRRIAELHHATIGLYTSQYGGLEVKVIFPPLVADFSA